MKESLENQNKELPLICSICHKNNLNIKQNCFKINKKLNKILNQIELTELIKKCNCNKINNFKFSQNNEIYVHKYCILLKIIFNFEIKCEYCNTIYNIKIDKKIDKKQKIFLFAFYLIIYIIHLFIYLFCLFLIFIDAILKKIQIFKYIHIIYFFAIILFKLNTIFLYISITQNIQKMKKINKYSINILDSKSENNNNNIDCSLSKQNEFYYLLFEFYEWFYNESMKYILININKKFFLNKIKNTNNDFIQKYIQENNINIITINEMEDKNNIKNQENSNNNLIDLNKNDILILNTGNNQNRNEINTKKINSNIEDINSNKRENKFDKKVSKTLEPKISKEDNLIINHKDFINININPNDSKNININIHIHNDRNSAIDFSSSKDFYQQKKKGTNIIKTALIPKRLSITQIISEAKSYKRKKRLIKSIKIKQTNVCLKKYGIIRNIEEDEEIDFSDIDKNEKSSNKNDLALKYNNFKSKKSFNNVDLNISNSDYGDNEEKPNNQFIRNSVRNNFSNKRVHFADS